MEKKEYEKGVCILKLKCVKLKMFKIYGSIRGYE